MSEGPVLRIYKYGRRTELHTDASKQGYGAVLLQEAEDGKLHPIYYMSKKTSPAEEKYDSYELEVLAIITALKKFRVYLLGQHFQIVTDCSAFQKTRHKKDLVTHIARWALQLEEFDYEIEHGAGNGMQHGDALSRHTFMIISNDTLTAKLKNHKMKTRTYKH
ncbi:Retrovirus-related Pol polyprotein from transposon 17.6 [Araneus ventricosus]|uniref:Retrovirus-related Pol polyprotein from transposon 17.6 n=1 Tax=Araneus ventricosus TaxID=182803 RepID=A0A4Y2AL62_ARAVE|nr:Retrovirus-related Pol polyprotein from transposon 17.6 [Araneus ventricosus]